MHKPCIHAHLAGRGQLELHFDLLVASQALEVELTPTALPSHEFQAEQCIPICPLTILGAYWMTYCIYWDRTCQVGQVMS